jgi:hypothetical protein
VKKFGNLKIFLLNIPEFLGLKAKLRSLQAFAGLKMSRSKVAQYGTAGKFHATHLELTVVVELSDSFLV